MDERGNPINLKMASKIAHQHVEMIDNVITHYIDGAIKVIESQGGDITKYALAQIDQPMEITKSDDPLTVEARTKVVFRIVPIEDIKGMKQEVTN